MIQGIKKGFSLVELLVVIAIIGILAAVGITAYSGYTSSAKEKATLANHAQVLALLNSEAAKCAAGAGDYVWGGACSDEAAEASIASYFESTLALKNPYARELFQVKTTDNAALADWTGGDGDQVDVQGQTAVDCTASGCTIATKQGSGADTFATILSY